jgi:LAO/AO transport system kinase
MMLDFKKDWEFRPPVNLAIAQTGEGIEEVFENIEKHRKFLEETGKLNDRRIERTKLEIGKIVQKKIENLVKNVEVDDLLNINKETDPYTIGEKIFEIIMR